jgi:hypothetical protein
MIQYMPASMVLAAVVAFAATSDPAPAAAEDLFNSILQDATDAISGQPSSSDTANTGNGNTGNGNTGAVNSAVVEEAEGIRTTGVAAFSYLSPGQQIDLGPQGTLKLTYFSSCTTEVIHGGTMIVGTLASKVSGGTVKSTSTQCNAQELAVDSSATEFGASVKRVTPFDPAVWAEATVSTRTPRFAWSGGDATLRIIELDSPQPRVAWQGQVKGPVSAYPKDAPPLTVGMPYRAEIDPSNGSPKSVVFSVDPGYVGSSGKVDTVSLPR